MRFTILVWEEEEAEEAEETEEPESIAAIELSDFGKCVGENFDVFVAAVSVAVEDDDETFVDTAVALDDPQRRRLDWDSVGSDGARLRFPTLVGERDIGAL